MLDRPLFASIILLVLCLHYDSILFVLYLHNYATRPCIYTSMQWHELEGTLRLKWASFSPAGIILVTMVLVLCLSFSGYLVQNIPVYFAWLGKVSYFSYAYAALVRLSHARPLARCDPFLHHPAALHLQESAQRS